MTFFLLLLATLVQVAEKCGLQLWIRTLRLFIHLFITVDTFCKDCKFLVQLISKFLQYISQNQINSIMQEHSGNQP